MWGEITVSLSVSLKVLCVCVCFFVFVFQVRVTLFSPSCPRMSYVDQAGHELRTQRSSSCLSSAGIKGMHYHLHPATLIYIIPVLSNGPVVHRWRRWYNIECDGCMCLTLTFLVTCPYLCICVCLEIRGQLSGIVFLLPHAFQDWSSSHQAAGSTYPPCHLTWLLVSRQFIYVALTVLELALQARPGWPGTQGATCLCTRLAWNSGSHVPLLPKCWDERRASLLSSLTFKI